MRFSTRRTAILVVALALATFSWPARAALPEQLSDAEYWKLIAEFSEPSGFFQYPIVTSNEISYQTVMPDLMSKAKSGGAYLGVGPEQNFTYIAALQPGIAFLIDIRRDMMLEHLLYKAVFEMSADRAAFVSNLFARKRPEGLTDDTPVAAMFRAFGSVPADNEFAEARLKDILARLKTTHRFPLGEKDEASIRTIYLTFVREGVTSFYSSFSSPGYAALMTLTDRAGKNWSFLAAADRYERVRAMHQKNLIVPLVGDFAGPKAIRMTAQYLRDRDITVHAFYLSNVEDYIQAVWQPYVENIASLPITGDSLFIRWSPATMTTLASIAEFLEYQQRPAPVRR